MPAFQPTADQFRAFRDDPHDGPIAQVNLLKFRVRAEYGPDEPEHGADETGADGLRPLRRRLRCRGRPRWAG